MVGNKNTFGGLRTDGVTYFGGQQKDVGWLRTDGVTYFGGQQKDVAHPTNYQMSI